MRHRSFLALGLLAACTWDPSMAFAGAWLQEEGTAYVRWSAGFLTARERFDENGDRVQWDTSGGGFRNGQYQDLAVALYTEVGIRRGWNAIVSGGWSRLHAEQPTARFTTRGFTDVTLGVKRALWTGGRTVTAAGAAVSVPTGYDVGDFPALGSGVTDVSLQALAGTSGAGLWGTTELEYRIRGGAFRDQVRGAVGGGWNASHRVGLRAELRGASAIGAMRDVGTTGEVRFDPTRYLDGAATLSVVAGRGLAVEGEVRSTLVGSNTLAGTRWSLAVATAPSWTWRR